MRSGAPFITRTNTSSSGPFISWTDTWREETTESTSKSRTVNYPRSRRGVHLGMFVCLFACRTACITLGRTVRSDVNVISPGSIQPYSNYSMKTVHSHTVFLPLSIARYSSIQLSELGRHEENKNAQASKWQQRGFEPGLPRSRFRRSMVCIWKSRGMSFGLKVRFLRATAFPISIYNCESCHKR